MMRFFRKLFEKLFKKRGDASPHLMGNHDLSEELPPKFREPFALQPPCDVVSNASGRFGYDQTNPIPVCLANGEREYLARLRCECDESFVFQRVGSLGRGPDGHMLDRYDLICKNKCHHITLYMDMYHEGASRLVPEGLTMGSPAGFAFPFKDQGFPEDQDFVVEDILERIMQKRKDIL